MSTRLSFILSVLILLSASVALCQNQDDNSRVFLNSKLQTYAVDSAHHSYFTDAFIKVLESDGGDDGMINIQEALQILEDNNLKADTSLTDEANKDQIEFTFSTDPKGRKGNNYALVICDENFDHFPELSGPERDLKKISQLLNEKFGFETEELINPTKTEFLTKLRAFAQKDYKKNDQLLIYFASRGSFDVLMNRDYLVFKDSKPDDELKMSFIAHTQLQTLISNFMVKKIMLIIDAGAR